MRDKRFTSFAGSEVLPVLLSAAREELFHCPLHKRCIHSVPAGVRLLAVEEHFDGKMYQHSKAVALREYKATRNVALPL